MGVKKMWTTCHAMKSKPSAGSWNSKFISFQPYPTHNQKFDLAKIWWQPVNPPMIREEYLIIHPLQTLQKQNHIHCAASQRHSRFSLWKWQKTRDSTSFRCNIPLRQNLRACRSTFPCPYYDNTRFRLFKISPQTNKSHGKEGELKGIDIPNTSKEKRQKEFPAYKQNYQSKGEGAFTPQHSKLQ